MAAIQRRLQAFYDQQEEDFCEIVAALIADQIICSTMQRRVLLGQEQKPVLYQYYRILRRPGMEK